MINLQNSLAGLLVGFLVGLTGMGGASLMAPILILIFHVRAKFAVGSDLAYLAVAKSLSAWQHGSAGNVDWRIAGQLALGSVPASLLGVWLLHKIDKHNSLQADLLITRLLGIVLILVALILVVRSIPKVEKWLLERHERGVEKGIGWTIAIGAAGGLLDGLTSVGAGTLFGVVLLLMFGLSAKKMVGTDLFHAALLSVAAASAHAWAGDVDYPLVGSLLIGAIPGILLGGSICARMPDRALRPTLATVLLLSGLRVLMAI